jgi:peroxiredoxin family protein
MPSDQKPVTLLIFNNDLDRAIAAFLVATGAASMGHPVSLYFAFWGLNVIQKKRVFRKKNLLEKMLACMLPTKNTHLPISKMQMAGIGPVFLKTMMQRKGVKTLPELIATAQDLGVKMTACEMSMDVMGIKHEELIDGVETSGVATYVADATVSGLTLLV